MKKLLFAALLSLAGVGLSTGQAKAWLFCHHCCHNCASICVRPYNAFSPSVFGSVCADGCFPLSFGNHGGMPPPPPPWMGAPPGMDGACCGSLGCAMDGGSCGTCATGEPQGAMMVAPSAGAPAVLPATNAVPTFQAPPPAPMPSGPTGPTTGVQGYPTGIQAAAYRGYAPAGYYPGYAPLPWMQPPSYPAWWHANAR